MIHIASGSLESTETGRHVKPLVRLTAAAEQAHAKGLRIKVVVMGVDQDPETGSLFATVSDFSIPLNSGYRGHWKNSVCRSCIRIRTVMKTVVL